jgi:predicted DsbA family dithiol-disulfide isomerase
MLIDIVSDTVCPWCFIGKRRLERALAQRPGLEVQIGWRPFELNPDMPPAGLDRAQYLQLKFGGVERAGRIYATIANAGAEEGIDFRFDRIRRTPNTIASHRLIRWAAGQNRQDAVVERLFTTYFVQGEDIGDHEVLTAVARDAGMDPELTRDLLTRGDDVEVVKAEEQVARRMGINGVPCFIVDRKYAISGAQDPAVLLQVFDLAVREAAAGVEAEPAPAGAS